MSTWLTKKEGYGSIPKEKDKWLSRNLKRFMLNTNAESSSVCTIVNYSHVIYEFWRFSLRVLPIYCYDDKCMCMTTAHNLLCELIQWIFEYQYFSIMIRISTKIYKLAFPFIIVYQICEFFASTVANSFSRENNHVCINHFRTYPATKMVYRNHII